MFHIRKIQIKTTIKYYCTPIRITSFEHWQCQMMVRMRSNKNSYSLLVGMPNGTATLEDILAGSCKTKYTLTLWSSNHAPCYLPKAVEHLCPYKTCMWIFIAALLVIAKTWEKARCSPGGEWINKQWYIHTMEYHSVLKRNEVSSCERP